MDLKAVNQMFQLEKRHLDVEYVTYKRNRLLMVAELEHWLTVNKIAYTFRAAGAGAILHVHDRRKAILFKLSWM